MDAGVFVDGFGVYMWMDICVYLWMDISVYLGMDV